MMAADGAMRILWRKVRARRRVVGSLLGPFLVSSLVHSFHSCKSFEFVQAEVHVYGSRAQRETFYSRRQSPKAYFAHLSLSLSYGV